MLRKGGMAVVIKCPHEPGNIGLPVTLIKRGSGDTKGMWLVDGAIKHAASNVPFKKPDEVPFRRAWALREWLAPLDGGVSDAEVKSLYRPRKPSKRKESA